MAQSFVVHRLEDYRFPRLLV